MSDKFHDQGQVNTIRTEIWKAAADKSLTKYDLIEKLLGAAGAFFEVSRVSYFEQSNLGSPIECKVQWCALGLAPYIGETLSPSVYRDLMKAANRTWFVLSIDSLPEENIDEARNYLLKHDIKSLFSIELNPEPLSFFSFSDTHTARRWSDLDIALIQEIINVVSMRMDQIRTEHEKAVLENQLRHTQTLEAIGQLAGGIAHDFNNILGAISGYAEMIRQKFAPGNPKLEKYSTAILSGAQKAADLTAQLLAFARRGRLQKISLNMHDVLSHVSLVLQHSLGKNIEVMLDLRSKMPFIKGDAMQMQNILLNLSMNARDAMPGGGTIAFVTTNGELPDLLEKAHPDAQEGPYFVLSVTDTGVGMDQETREKLFEPFFTTKDIGKGVGLGLASVYGIVTSHNGFIEVDSEVGRGTAVSLYFPVDRDVLLRQRSAAANDITRGSGTVVLIDNDELFRNVCREMLSDLGYGVVEFDGAAAALSYYQSNWKSVDLVITDMIMEGLNGMACFQELKKINPSVRAILSSGYSFDSELPDLLKEGIAGVIQKPFDAQRLSKVVAEVLR